MQNHDDISRYVDTQAALARVGGNEAIYKKLLGMFVQSSEFAKMDEALENKDYPAAAEFAHAIKGITGNLSLPELFDLSTSLMNQMRNGAPDPETLQNYYAALENTQTYVQQILAE